jgi:hypothetical protein
MLAFSLLTFIRLLLSSFGLLLAISLLTVVSLLVAVSLVAAISLLWVVGLWASVPPLVAMWLMFVVACVCFLRCVKIFALELRLHFTDFLCNLPFNESGYGFLLGELLCTFHRLMLFLLPSRDDIFLDLIIQEVSEAKVIDGSFEDKCELCSPLVQSVHLQGLLCIEQI